MFLSLFRNLVILTFALHIIRASEILLGVHPINAAFYVPFEPFTCLDKSAVIPWSKVNDDYCDCIDGSDEPGTSACPDMKFYCANEDHEGSVIPSSFVNDMVCDCCDGSDEYNGYVKCNDTCGTLAKEKKVQLEKLKKAVEDGHQIYKEYVTKKAVELAEEERRRTEEAERLAREAEQKAAEEEEAADEHVKADAELEHEKVEETAPETGAQVEPPQPQEGVEESKSEELRDQEEGDEEHVHDEEVHADVPQEEDLAPLPPEPAMPPPSIDYGPDNGFMMLTEPSLGCLELEEKEYVYELCAFREVRQRSRGAPKGSGVYLGRWREWVGHPEGSVDWSREEKLAKLPYDEMLYDGGEGCWNGPSRSVRVKVMCGAENRLVSAEEPSRCVYQIRIETPAACHHEPDKMLQLMHTEL